MPDKPLIEIPDGTRTELSLRHGETFTLCVDGEPVTIRVRVAHSGQAKLCIDAPRRIVVRWRDSAIHGRRSAFSHARRNRSAGAGERDATTD